MNSDQEPVPECETAKTLFQTVTAVAEAEGCGPLELPPLYDAIDSEVFDKAFGKNRPAEISFSYLDYQITILGDGQVRLAEKQITS